ncbi:MAG: hypothetical protein JWQ98_3573 [Chlorobi bacterium]|nr:hypothetical protein [Chlorobiota bacterium]
MATITPYAAEKLKALRRMKMIATGAFLLMTAIFFISERFGTGRIIWFIHWDHVNAFAEASMVGALADWFAVVALFRHPLGIPIWHTAIIPNKKDEIGRNLGNFVETRLLSVENLSTEIGRFSASQALLKFLSSEEQRKRAAGWLTEAVGAMVRALDDRQIEGMIADMASSRLQKLNAATLLGSGLDMVIASNKHHELIDQTLRQVADWVPSRREMIHEFIERSVERTLKWGSRLVPKAMIERATDQTLGAVIDVLTQAADDPNHPMRADLNNRIVEWAEKIKTDPEWIGKINSWKDEIIGHPGLRSSIAGIWTQTKEWILNDIESEDSTVNGYALRAVESLNGRLQDDPALRETIDIRLREGVITLLSSNHHAIGELIQRVVDAWDGEQLSRELELNLGKDLQYIRLNGTFIGGVVGLLIHLIR